MILIVSLTSITVLTNTLTTLYSAKERLISDTTFKEITDTVNKEFIINILHSIAATTTVLATATTGIGIPFGALVTVYLFSKLYRKITDSEYIKTLTKNKEIKKQFVGFWKTPNYPGLYGLKPNFLGDNLTKNDFTGR